MMKMLVFISRITHHASRITPVLLVALLAKAAPAFAAPADIAGNWLGTLEVEQTKLRLLFKITRTPEGAWSAAPSSTWTAKPKPRSRSHAAGLALVTTRSGLAVRDARCAAMATAGV